MEDDIPTQRGKIKICYLKNTVYCKEVKFYDKKSVNRARLTKIITKSVTLNV